ncbi:hypothetical protein Hanom_Chr08g00738191 [Helianthus anomalus]
MERRLSKYIETTRFLEANYENKQWVLNEYIDELANVKLELAKKEKKVNKIQSYHASSYILILERIFNVTPDDYDSEKNSGSEFHQVPPPL